MCCVLQPTTTSQHRDLSITAFSAAKAAVAASVHLHPSLSSNISGRNRAKAVVAAQYVEKSLEVCKCSVHDHVTRNREVTICYRDEE
jgi:hypothetical protein